MKDIILVVEDEFPLLRAIEKKLNLNNFDVFAFATGKEAIDYLNNCPTLPKAIWLDYYLPDMNGLDFMKNVKDNDSWKNIPIMVVSNSDSNENEKNMLSLGANKYIIKAEKNLSNIIEDMKKLIDEKL